MNPILSHLLSYLIKMTGAKIIRKYSKARTICIILERNWATPQPSSVGYQYFALALSRYPADALVQDCSNYSALAMELLQSWTKPSLTLYQSRRIHNILWSTTNLTSIKRNELTGTTQPHILHKRLLGNWIYSYTHYLRSIWPVQHFQTSLHNDANGMM